MTTTSSNNDDDFLSDEEILDDIYKKDTAQGVTAPPPAISTRAFEQDMVVGPVNVKPPVSRNNAPAKLLTKSGTIYCTTLSALSPSNRGW